VSSIGAIWMTSWSALEGRRPPQFRSTTDVVRVYATVQDRTGHLVTDLREEDFELRDRGTIGPLAVFSADAQPLSIAGAATTDRPVTDWTSRPRRRPQVASCESRCRSLDQG
jgi:hypothetical protein